MSETGQNNWADPFSDLLKRFPPSLAHLRFTVERRDGIAYIAPPVCFVSAGEFLMGYEAENDPAACEDEAPQHTVYLPDFSIGRFPVTVAEYACFVAAEHHRSPQAWLYQLQWLDHPATWLSWDDAVAYAAWLSECDGHSWRLPTEAEWEKAARWDSQRGAARLYPWGDTFDASRCNSDEGGRGKTTTVGIFPHGASPYGVEDMSGNISEWTHSLYRPYPYTVDDGREVDESPELRVLRGGSWFHNSEGVRVVSRDRIAPDFPFGNVFGFRLALTGPDP